MASKEIQQIVDKLTVIDDTFFHKLVEDYVIKMTIVCVLVVLFYSFFKVRHSLWYRYYALLFV